MYDLPAINQRLSKLVFSNVGHCNNCLINDRADQQRPPFKHQMSLIRKTDILVGIHGAGLTHMLFLPDWAAVFELYHCEDPECYRDLARMRGVKHIGWADPSKLTPVPSEQPQPGYAGTASAKFQDYRFDPLEVLRLTNLAKSHVTSHPAFNENHQGKEEL